MVANMEALEQSVIGPLVGRSEQTYGVDVQIRVLGPIEVVRDDVEVRLGGPKQRTTLALLAADVGKVVSVDALIDGLWGDEPTAGARSTLQTYVSNLRGELGDVIVREGSGYRLDVDPEQVDAVQFERELVRAHELAQANPAETSQRIRSALALWRGHPYAGVPASFRLELEASRLEELRLGALETRIEAELALGHHAELVPELEVLCTEYPVREGFRAQHMLALYRSGRQAEALRAFQKTRAYLAEELGLEPSTQLRELEHRILNQDSTLELESEPQVQTLAFLLTDIEDSTVLWEMQTAAMRSAVAEHDRIVFGAVEAAGGRVVKRVGDGIDTAFANAGAAVRAAEQIQRELFAVDWGDTGPLAVRMAIDLGAVEARRGDYFGPVLNRAGRMLAAGHGGQVLLSSDAHAALAATESGWQAKALGEFRFKGIGSPQSVFQLLLDGLPAEFAPLRIDRLPPLVPALAFGRALRGYELRENVGSGDFGIVYRAYQPSVGREVAIKVIRPELVNQLSFVRRFEAEAQLIAQLEHPHIVSLYDYWRDPDGAYLVMRWLRGGSLRQALERGPWHAEPAARLLAQIGGALAYAHRQGVVHGDLKPGNVLLDDEGHAYLSDFGIATRSGDSAEPGRVVSSSPAYVPPEELAADAKTPRSDIYSLGLLTFELLTGRRPPMDGALPSVTDVRPELPQDVNAVVAKATAHEPDERHATVEAFLAAFGQALGAPAPAVTYTPAENPYKGLRAFGEADADDFFGRDALAAELVAAVRDHRLVALVGPSGIGKSSVVRAGLIPALRRGMSAESVSWVISDMFPGSYPFEELAAALLRVAVERPDDLMQQLSRDELGMSRVMKRILPPGGELLLVVDQFEELFTLTADEDDRQRFLDGLTRLAADGRSRVRVVVTLRADFLDHPLRYPEFGELVKAGMVAVTAPSDDDLALAIERPAARAGVRFEPGVVSHVIGDVRDQPGALPLLQYALTELFAARTSDVLTLEAYRATGGVVGALGRRAEELYGRLDNAGQAATRQVFLRLVTVDSQAQDTRRRVRRRELRRLEIEPTVLETILAQYGEHRLLTFDREALTRSPTVEVAHEALLTQWERLRSWVDERREDLLLQRRLVEAVQEWEESGRQADYLPRAGRLAQFESWAGATDLALTAGEREFLAEARTAAEAAARRRARRRRAILAGFAFLAIVASVLAAFGFVQREDARAAATVAEAQRLGSQALVEDDLDRSLLLARTGVAVDDSVQTQGNLLAALLRSPAAIAVMQGDGDRLLELDLSPDGRTLAVGDNDGTVVFLDPQTGRRVGRPIHVPGSVLGVVFTPDGSSLVIAGAGRSGFVRLYDARSRALRTKLPVVMREGEAPAETVVSPDGGMIAVTLFTDRPASPPARAVRWDARTGRPLGRPVDVVNGDLVGGLAFTRDAKQLLIGGGGRLTVWDARTMKRVRSFPGDAFSIATAPDGRTIAFGARRDGTVTFLDLVTGAQRKGGGRHAASVQGVAFSPDGTTLVSTGDDRKVIVWDVASGTERETLEGHAGRVHAQDFSPDGNTVYTASLDARMIAWDVEGARRVGRPLRHSDSPEANIASVVSSDGKTFATVAQDGTVRFRRLVTGSVVGKPLRGFRGEVVWIALSPDGRTLAAVGAGGPGILWDTHTGVRRELGGWTAERSGWASFSADGKTLVTGGTEVSLWDIATGRRIADFNAGGYMSEASLSPDGTMLATAGDGGRVIIWDVEERMRITELKADENFASTARFSPDGKLLATGGVDGNAILWNTKTWQRVGRPLGGHAGFVITVDFDEDGGTLASSSTDGNVRLWDVASGRQVGSGLPGPGNQWSTVHFVPNAKRLLAVYATGIALVWDVDPERWKRQACTVAGRNLTRAEWDEFLPGRDYRAVCP
jgi:WD40 repeat protein/serine/threonine protein kinase/DNA-binding SARP family transcriptional activator